MSADSKKPCATELRVAVVIKGDSSIPQAAVCNALKKALGLSGSSKGESSSPSASEAALSCNAATAQAQAGKLRCSATETTLKNGRLSLIVTVEGDPQYVDDDKIPIRTPATLRLWNSLMSVPVQYDASLQALADHFNNGAAIVLHDFLGVCQSIGVIETATPLHGSVRDRMRHFWRFLSPLAWFSLEEELPAVLSYFGPRVAFYFAWMDHYLTWLVGPAVLGLVLYVLRPADETVDDSAAVPLYSLFLVLWSFTYIKCWQRRETELTYLWSDPTPHILHPPSRQPSRQHVQPKHDNRPVVWKKLTARFRRLSFVSRISLSARVVYFAKAGVSWLVTLVLLMGVAMLQIISLNLQGYVSGGKDGTAEGLERGGRNVFYFPAVARFSKPGAVFDPSGPMLVSLFPVIVHVAVIYLINATYRWIAWHLTVWEGGGVSLHPSTDGVEGRSLDETLDALLLKRFVFESIDCYFPLIYIAFYELDILQLRRELQSLYVADCIRRVVTESLIPLVLHSLDAASLKPGGFMRTDSFVSRLRGNGDKQTAEQEVERNMALDEYEAFDDYLEIVIQFGYVTLFASAFPLASLLSIVQNLIEIRSDLFKLFFVCRRPIPHGDALPLHPTNPSQPSLYGIGRWRAVLNTLVWLAVPCNCFLFAFSSEQLMQYLPSYFVRRGGNQWIKQGKGLPVAFIVFGLEHALLLIGVAIHTCVPNCSDTVLQKVIEESELVSQHHMMMHNNNAGPVSQGTAGLPDEVLSGSAGADEQQLREGVRQRK